MPPHIHTYNLTCALSIAHHFRLYFPHLHHLCLLLALYCCCCYGCWCCCYCYFMGCVCVITILLKYVSFPPKTEWVCCVDADGWLCLRVELSPIWMRMCEGVGVYVNTSTDCCVWMSIGLCVITQYAVGSFFFTSLYSLHIQFIHMFFQRDCVILLALFLSIFDFM